MVGAAALCHCTLLSLWTAMDRDECQVVSSNETQVFIFVQQWVNAWFGGLLAWHSKYKFLGKLIIILQLSNFRL